MLGPAAVSHTNRTSRSSVFALTRAQSAGQTDVDFHNDSALDTPQSVPAAPATRGSSSRSPPGQKKNPPREVSRAAGSFEEWRRGESNPRPEITLMPASTCLFGIL